MELLKLLQDRSDLTLLTNSAEAIHGSGSVRN